MLFFRLNGKTIHNMKHLTLCALACGMLASVSGQNTPSHRLSDIPQVAPDQRVPAPRTHVAFTGEEAGPRLPFGESHVGDVTHEQVRELVVTSEVIGITQYDLQSNSAVDNRLAGSTSSMLSSAWIMSLELTPWADRGTGYNAWMTDSWGEQPYERVEAVRTGWPSIVHTDGGREVVVSHAGIDTPLHMAWRDAGNGAWSEADIPSELTVGKLWPRMASGGEDGNSLHVICISTPEGNGGTLLDGQNGAILYYRSTDGGDTWDITDHQFAELDSSNFVGFGGDTYAIHARGNTVAFAVFNDFADTFVMVSEDNGDTWTKHTIVDFPVDMYVIDDGLPEIGEDWNEDGLFQEFFNADGAGAVHVDVNSEVHVTFGEMYYMDDDTTDGGTFSYFPGVNGLAYWNESLGEDSIQSIAYAYDIDESQTLDLEDDIALYYVSLSGFPSMGSDANGNLYVSYSAIREDYTTGSQNYRHVYIVHSEDNGATWNSDSACDVTPDSDYDGFESVFACMSPTVENNELHLIYQRDFEPGLSVRGDEDPTDINDIVHLMIPADGLNDCADVTVEEPASVEEFDAGAIRMFPNPASGAVDLVTDIAGAYTLRVYSPVGALMVDTQVQNPLHRLDVSAWADGLYLVELTQGAKRSVNQLSVAH